MAATVGFPDRHPLPGRRLPASRVRSRHPEVWGARTARSVPARPTPVQPTPSRLTPSQQAWGGDGRYPERNRRP